MYEGFSFKPDKAQEVPAAEAQEIQSRLRGRLDALPPEEKARLNELVWPSVIPWTGDGYRLGLNGLFSFVPQEMKDRVDAYVQMPAGEDRDAMQEELRSSLTALWSEHFDEINKDLRAYA